jgi:putative FmdB family regulatory protein
MRLSFTGWYGMPIYEYECPKCGRFEVIHKSTDKPVKLCPTCKEKGKEQKVTKAMSASAFHLKGTGWYKTDYSSGSTAAGGGKKAASTGVAAAAPAAEKADASAAPAAASSEATPTKGSCGPACGCH